MAILVLLHIVDMLFSKYRHPVTASSNHHAGLRYRVLCHMADMLFSKHSNPGTACSNHQAALITKVLFKAKHSWYCMQ